MPTFVQELVQGNVALPQLRRRVLEASGVGERPTWRATTPRAEGRGAAPCRWLNCSDDETIAALSRIEAVVIHMFWHSVLVFERGKLFRNPAHMVRQSAIGACTTAVSCVLLAKLMGTVWLSVLLSVFLTM